MENTRSRLLTVWWRCRLLVVSAVRWSGFRLPLTVAALIDVGRAATEKMIGVRSFTRTADFCPLTMIKGQPTYSRGSVLVDLTILDTFLLKPLHFFRNPFTHCIGLVIKGVSKCTWSEFPVYVFRFSSEPDQLEYKWIWIIPLFKSQLPRRKILLTPDLSWTCSISMFMKWSFTAMHLVRNCEPIFPHRRCALLWCSFIYFLFI